jgi:two-component system, OmpR family, response regulator
VARASHEKLPVVAVKAPEATLDVCAPSGVRVLVADDDARVRQIVATAISSIGFHVFATEDGAPALTIAAQEAPDLAIVDFDMPTPGLDVVRKLKALHGAAIWVAVLSGREDEASRAASFAAGADDVLIKPVILAELKRRVVAAARGQQALAEARRSRERAERLLAGSTDAAAKLVHDLNNCLAVALGNMAYLQEVARLGEGETQSLIATVGALRRMSGLVGSFAAAPRPDAPARQAGSGHDDPTRTDLRDGRRR